MGSWNMQEHWDSDLLSLVTAESVGFFRHFCVLHKSAWTCHFFYCTRECESVLSKTAIFPTKEGRKREISNESEWGSSLREANV